MKLAKSFWTSKTTWATIVTIITAVGTYAQHEIGVKELLGVVIYAIFKMFERDTTAKLHELLEGMSNGSGQD